MSINHYYYYYYMLINSLQSFRSRVSLIILVVILFSSLRVEGQGSPYIGNFSVGEQEEENPFYQMRPSPEVATLGKFGNIPVDYYTGIARIEVPIHTIEDGEIQVPIILKYHQGGISTSELAPNTGLGWALEAGGYIARTVRGKPDEQGGYASGFSAINQNRICEDQTSYASDIHSLSVDGLPDNFSYAFGGQSGKFQLNVDELNRIHDPILIPHRPLEFSEILPSLPHWEIKDANGIKYNFGTKEMSQSISCNPFVSTTSAWKLDLITSPNANKSVSFRYNQMTPLIYKLPTSFTRVEKMAAPVQNFSVHDYQACFSEHALRSQRLEEIIASSGEKVKFIYSASGRCDLVRENGQTPGEYLSAVLVENLFGDIVKTVKFFYSYRGQNGVYPATDPCPSTVDGLDLRLILDSLEIYGTDTSVDPVVYKFDYYSKGAKVRSDGKLEFPNRLTQAKDYWGFYNGKSVNDLDEYNNEEVFKEENRLPNFNYAVIGTLARVTYPTGGFTLFRYNLHKIINEGQNGADILYGGLRLRRMEDHSNVSSPVIKEYDYDNGGWYREPIRESYLDYDHSWMDCDHCQGAPNNNCCYIRREIGTLRYISSEIPYGKVQNQGSALAYGMVTERRSALAGGSLGKTIYKFYTWDEPSRRISCAGWSSGCDWWKLQMVL